MRPGARTTIRFPITKELTVGLFSKSPEEKAAIAELKNADAALHANQRREEKAGIRHETPEYQRLNAAANQAADKVSWWHGGTKR